MKLYCLNLLISLIVISIFTCTINCEQSKIESTAKTEIEGLSQSKTLSTVTAEVEEESQLKSDSKSFSYYSKMYLRKLLSFNTPINKCHEENCQYCCLSLNYCGSKKQCENSHYTMNILKAIFYFICGILGCTLIYKIYITDSLPEHTDENKIDDNTLNLLIGLFIQNRDNRKKFKL